MKIVYSCYGGAHSSRVAAAIHLGRLPGDRPPSPRELLAVPRFDDVGSDELGLADHIGQDAQGHDVYVMGRGPARQVAVRALQSGFDLGGGARDQLLIVDTLAAVNLWMRIGGFLSRRLGLVSLGRPLVVRGTIKAYADLVRLVDEAKRKIAPAPGSP